MNIYAAIITALLLISSSTSQVKWMQRALLPNQLTECGSVVLSGKIYIIGGLEPGAVSTSKVHVFDAANNSWSLAAPLPMPMHHMACAVVNSKIYVLGGYTDNPFQPVSNSYVYDPLTNDWTAIANVPTVRGSSAAAEMGGKIYVLGGAGYNLLQSNDVNEAYDPLTDTWEVLAPMPTPRDHHSAVTLDSLIYSVGGRNFTLNIGRNKIVEAYSPATNTWHVKSELLWARTGFGLVAAGGKIFAIGGEWFTPGQNGLITEMEMYDPLLGHWIYAGNMNTTRHGFGAGVVGDTIYTISGGIQAGYSYSDLNESFILTETIGLQQLSAGVREFELKQNYPNPFNPSTQIEFSIFNEGFVSLKVYDITGKEIRTLIYGHLKTGSYKYGFTSQGLASGIYIYSLLLGNNSINKKMTILK